MNGCYSRITSKIRKLKVAKTDCLVSVCESGVHFTCAERFGCLSLSVVLMLCMSNLNAFSLSFVPHAKYNNR